MVASRGVSAPPWAAAGDADRRSRFGGGASKINGAGFTPQGGYDSVYLASDPITAQAEVQAIMLLPGGPTPVQTPPLTVLSIAGVVSQVLDLTDPPTLTMLETNEQEVSGA